jgi:hypothetical protein
MPLPAYSWLTWVQAVQALANRLLDPAMVYWTNAELQLYLIEALQTWNALTGIFVADFGFTYTPATAPWLSLSIPGTPRSYTATDAALYTLCQYHLLEPPSGAGAWIGTPQFSLADLTAALQQRQDEMVQLTATGVIRLHPTPITPNTRRVTLADDVLEVRRARFVPAAGFGTPQTLWREDPYVFETSIPGYPQSPQMPREYSVTSQPPLSIDTDYPPNVPGALDLLAILSSIPPAPPNPVGLSIPDDWTWVLKWGMLADVLGKQSEAQDTPRQQYALARYIEGVAFMQRLPWIMTAQLNGRPVGIEGVMEKDQYDSGWEGNASARPGLVVAGIDTFSICPRPTGSNNTGVVMQVIQAAPVSTASPVQVSRDTFDDILDYCVHLASFKMGGAEFAATMPLFDNFRKAVVLTNSRIGKLATFDDVLKQQGQRSQEVDQRFAQVTS